jgi:hypothetical protein
VTAYGLEEGFKQKGKRLNIKVAPELLWDKLEVNRNVGQFFYSYNS